MTRSSSSWEFNASHILQNLAQYSSIDSCVCCYMVDKLVMIHFCHPEMFTKNYVHFEDGCCGFISNELGEPVNSNPSQCNAKYVFLFFVQHSTIGLGNNNKHFNVSVRVDAIIKDRKWVFDFAAYHLWRLWVHPRQVHWVLWYWRGPTCWGCCYGYVCNYCTCFKKLV